ncbi:hypothetical protein SAMN04488003_10689 [Loktanella fryxellensis]|uniref:Uncharacterized protein n=1 Tax=Loktanella fryxellensis TaxID=245187 RepID=A0A1H8C914_9RHOB|nr:hypothetical protein [Loktanella fryxellensis]SEM90944.1 hypothetical protein SAMN04488003_10689 [Loktanella fryxellensis]
MRRLLAAALALVATLAGLLAALVAVPVGYVELACRPQGAAVPYAAILPPEHHRPEGRTLLTYPEWHIVHAYADYAAVIRTDDPHDYGYVAGIAGFWGSLCDLSRASGPHGGFPGAFKSTVYTIGVSFTVELLAKAAYEETLGRIAVAIRGADRAPLDDLSATQAAAYAAFLRQVPWYRWDFATDAAALDAAATDTFRDTERRAALGAEYGIKAAYAQVIGAAVAVMPPDALRLRMIVRGLDATTLSGLPEVTVIRTRPEGVEIDTPRYAALTMLLQQMAAEGGDFVEIAGNDDILMTVTTDAEEAEGALSSMTRQGSRDRRHLILLPVTALAQRLRDMDGTNVTLEHIHDY